MQSQGGETLRPSIPPRLSFRGGASSRSCRWSPARYETAVPRHSWPAVNNNSQGAVHDEENDIRERIGVVKRNTTSNENLFQRKATPLCSRAVPANEAPAAPQLSPRKAKCHETGEVAEGEVGLLSPRVPGRISKCPVPEQAAGQTGLPLPKLAETAHVAAWGT
ncbi:unnamed protein product [Lampetra planeri]